MASDNDMKFTFQYRYSKVSLESSHTRHLHTACVCEIQPELSCCRGDQTPHYRKSLLTPSNRYRANHISVAESSSGDQISSEKLSESCVQHGAWESHLKRH